MWKNEENEENTFLGINDVTWNPEIIKKRIQKSEQAIKNQQLDVFGGQQ